MAARGSIAVRAVIALVLMVMFFAIAIGAIVGLVVVGGVLIDVLGDVSNGRGVVALVIAAITCFAAAGIVAYSVLPRPDRFEPPGPEIHRDEHPALFTEIDRIADATGEPAPIHVYLVNDVNAFVAERGGVMGIGSRRVMGIGMPLLRTLTVSELRAVLAHEMGHFYGGDTRLGPWIYKTRGSMIRTVVNLQKAGAGTAEVSFVATILLVVVRAPFLWFAHGFLRVSQAVSRAQEYSADGVAVRVEGAAALTGGLRKTHAAAIAHSLYLRDEVGPLVDAGVLPPVGEGFSRFLGSKQIAGLLDKVVDAELTEGEQDPYDSHPPLRERIAAAELLPGATPPPPDDRPAIVLVADPERYESEPIRALVETRLRSVGWSETGDVWIKSWRDNLDENRDALTGLTIASVRRAPRDLRALARKVHDALVDGADDDAIRGWATGTLATALAIRLIELGYQVDSSPGAPHRLRLGDVEVQPWTEVGEWLRGDGTDDAFATRWARLGLPYELVGAAGPATT